MTSSSRLTTSTIGDRQCSRGGGRGAALFAVSVAATSGQRLILDVVCWDTEQRPAIQRAVGEFAWQHLYRNLVYSMADLRPEPGDPLGCPRFPENW